jgi:hypothetical protein
LKVVVIGAGPSGLAAAHAAIGMNASVVIMADKKVKTPQRGPIMLHRPIPGINTDQPQGYVRQIVIGGSILDYRLKTYGDVNISINGDILDPGFHTWPVPIAYDTMWQLYEKLIIEKTVYPGDVPALIDQADLVVNTAPMPSLCSEPRKHHFQSFPIALIFKTSYPNQPDNTVIYNAKPEFNWVRSSSIFGERVTEYNIESALLGVTVENPFPKIDPDLVIRKPLWTTCNCHPKMLRTGRFGKWHNETWIDHAYYETRSALVSKLFQDEWDGVV